MSIALVNQVAAKTVAGGSATKNVAISAPGAGNALRLMIVRDPATTISSVTGGGVTWTRLSTVTDTVATITCDLYGGDNSSGSGTTVAITISNTYSTLEVNVSEWSGLGTAPVTDPAPSTNTGTSSTLTTAAVTPTAGKNLLLLACGAILNGTHTVTNTPSGGFTALTRSATANYLAFAYQIVASASGSYQTTWPISVSYSAWAAIIAGWDAAAGGGGSPPPSNLLLLGCG